MAKSVFFVDFLVGRQGNQQIGERSKPLRQLPCELVENNQTVVPGSKSLPGHTVFAKSLCR